MIVFISHEPSRSVVLRKMLLDGDIFAYHRGFPDLLNSHGLIDFIKALPSPPAVAIIDSSLDCNFGEKACKLLKQEYPKVKCIAITDKEMHKKVRYKYLISSDFETDAFPSSYFVDVIKEILSKCGYCLKRSYMHLKLGDSSNKATLLGYPLNLTRAEYRILLFLCQSTDKRLDEETILCFCFAESYRMTETNVRAHISSINRKAKALSGRKLIICHRNAGYQINPYM